MWRLILIVPLTLLFILVLFRSERRRRSLASRIPGPKGIFLIGLLSICVHGPEKFVTNALAIYRKYEKSIFKLWICNHLYIILTQPEDIEFVLMNPKLQIKSKEYVVMRESIMGEGIFSTEDIKKWKKNRKIVIGGLNFTILKSFIPTFYEEAVVLNEKLQKNCDLKSKDCKILGPISNATMEMIGKTAFGVKLNAQDEINRHRFVENLQTVLHTWEYRIAHPWYLNKMLFRFSSISKIHDRSKKIINEFADEIINKRIEELKQTTDKSEMDDCVYKKPMSVVEILLENHNVMSLEQIRDEIITVMIGGQETTAIANSTTIYMLAHHQDIQQKVFDELQSIFLVGDYHRAPTYEDLIQMEYLERVIKETLRLFPPLPVFGRRLEEETLVGNYLCPAGSTLLIVPLFLQSSPKFYADPNRYDPDNFLPDACRTRHPYAFIPFSGGYRNCIGNKYAMLQMKTVISTLVRRNVFLPSDKCPTPENLRLMFLATLKFVNDLYVKIEPRNST